ncbi:MAG: endonuclease domain-containing protein [Actinomycetota bacterium]
MAAALWSRTGAVARRTAGALHGLSGLSEGGIVEIISARQYEGDAPIRILERPLLDACEVCMVDLIPATTPERTWLDLAAIYPDFRVEQWLDELLRRNLAHLDEVLDRFGSLAARGRNGIGRARRILAARDASAEIPRSEIETDFARLARRFRLPPYQSQFAVPIDGRVAYLDFAYPESMLGIEVDSWLYHSDRQSFESDRARADELVALGWRILHFTSRQIRQRAGWVADKTLAALSVAHKLKSLD